MQAKGVRKKSGKPFIIANPIYDTVFKRLMENQRIAKFFLNAILEQPVEDLTVLPQEFIYKLDGAKVVPEREKPHFYSFFRLDFMATLRDADGKPRKVLIELQKSWDTLDVMRFRKYLGEQYRRMDILDGQEAILPVTTIYILGNNLAEISCACVKVGRIYTDMQRKQPIDARSKFIENLTHDSYVIQTGRIRDVRCTTNLDKLLSIFEQRHFIEADSDVRKEYPYQPDDEDMELITDILYEMGADPKERKQIENEKEALRVINNMKDPLKKALAEKDKVLKEKDKVLKEKDKALEKKDKALAEKDKALTESKKVREEQVKLLEKSKKDSEEQSKLLAESKKVREEQEKRIARLEQLVRAQQAK
ncbi:MAG: hypothetical protein LBB79_10415 [Prevotellaceae bacterium]|jgi:hypothetical protein|nr:hypothetical protein [Prevotellaceae bacterium]